MKKKLLVSLLVLFSWNLLESSPSMPFEQANVDGNFSEDNPTNDTSMSTKGASSITPTKLIDGKAVVRIYTQEELQTIDIKTIIQNIAKDILTYYEKSEETDTQERRLEYFIDIICANSKELAEKINNLNRDDLKPLLDAYSQSSNAKTKKYYSLYAPIRNYCAAKIAHANYLEAKTEYRKKTEIKKFWEAITTLKGLKITFNFLKITSRFLKKITGLFLSPEDYQAFAYEAKTPEQLMLWFSKADAHQAYQESERHIFRDDYLVNKISEAQKQVILKKMVDDAIKNAVEKNDYRLLDLFSQVNTTTPNLFRSGATGRSVFDFGIDPLPLTKQDMESIQATLAKRDGISAPTNNNTQTNNPKTAAEIAQEKAKADAEKKAEAAQETKKAQEKAGESKAKAEAAAKNNNTQKKRPKNEAY